MQLRVHGTPLSRNAGGAANQSNNVFKQARSFSSPTLKNIFLILHSTAFPLSSFPTSHWPTHTCPFDDMHPSFDAAKLPPIQRDLIGCPKRHHGGCILS